MIANVFDRPLPPVPDQVRVYVAGRGESRAICTCNHIGKSRLLRAVAKNDAWEHAMQTGHMPATPLVVR